MYVINTFKNFSVKFVHCQSQHLRRFGSLPSSVVVIVLCVHMYVYMLTTQTVVAKHYYPIKAYKISIAIVDY